MKLRKKMLYSLEDLTESEMNALWNIMDYYEKKGKVCIGEATDRENMKVVKKIKNFY